MRKLNGFLRGLFLIFGALFLITELLPERKATLRDKEGFDNEEFDDIW